MVCLPFELRNWETAADSRAFTPVIRLNFKVNCDRAWPLQKVPVVGNNAVASRLLSADTSTLWISTNVTKDADSDCSGTIAGTLLLFMFMKKGIDCCEF